MKLKEKENEKTAFYAEYQNTGEGALVKERASFGHQLKNLDGYNVEEILLGEDGWNPVKNGNELLKNIGNLAQRSLAFANKNFEGMIPRKIRELGEIENKTIISIFTK